MRFFRPRPRRHGGGFRLVVDALYLDAARNREAGSGFSFDSKVLAAALRNIYHRRYDPRMEIDGELFEEVSRVFDAATDIGFAGSETDGDFMRQLRTNNSVFAAFKTHRMGRDMAAQLIDENGELKPFERFLQDVEPIASHHVDSWLRTEYDTAIKRAHRAAEMRQFISEADVLPNIEWLPSTAVNPRESHMPFYHRIWPVDAPFWEDHKPGDEWGCQCGWAATAEPPTDNSGLDGERIKPSPGLTGNPARTARIFSDDHPYFPSDCKGCPFKGIQLSLFTDKAKDCYRCKNILQAVQKAEKTLTTKRAELAEKKIDATARISKLPLSAPVVHASPELKYGTVMCSKSDIRQLVYHAADAESVTVALKMDRYRDRLRFVRTEQPKHFTEKKQMRGLVEYTVYELDVDGQTFVVKCEARTKSENAAVLERPYTIYKK